MPESTTIVKGLPMPNVPNSPGLSFFHLPPELRQKVYDEILPKDRTLIVACHQSGPRHLPPVQRIVNFCRAHPVISRELWSWIKKRMIKLKVVISTRLHFSKLDLHLIPFDEAHEIEIVIDHPPIWKDTITLQALRAKITEFVDILKLFPTLPSVRVSFREKKMGLVCFDHDRALCKQVWFREPSSPDDTEVHGWGLTLAYVDDYEMPIVEFLLRPFVQLPICESFAIEPLSTRLVGAEDLHREEEPFLHDQLYAYWLFGDIKEQVERRRRTLQ